MIELKLYISYSSYFYMEYEKMSLGELSKLTGRSRSTIQSWKTRGVVKEMVEECLAEEKALEEALQKGPNKIPKDLAKAIVKKAKENMEKEENKEEDKEEEKKEPSKKGVDQWVLDMGYERKEDVIRGGPNCSYCKYAREMTLIKRDKCLGCEKIK